MTERVLTDAEIDRVADVVRRASLHGFPGFKDFARAVEAAVLAKVSRNPYGIPCFPGYVTEAEAQRRELAVEAKIPSCMCRGMGIGTVPEREARTRERAAWDASSRHDCGDPNVVPHAGCSRCDAERDLRYPLPTTTRPRTVTLSDGTRISSGGAGLTSGVFRFAKTPADARLLADLMERPTEDVPDNA